MDLVQRGGQRLQLGHRSGQGLLADDGGQTAGRGGVPRADPADRGAPGLGRDDQLGPAVGGLTATGGAAGGGSGDTG